MTRFVWTGEDWLEYDPREEKLRRAYAKSVFPTVIRDTPAYVSPVSRKVVEGRAARREDLRRSGCREVDPSEFTPTYFTEKYAKIAGKDRETRPKIDLGDGYIRRKAK